MATTYCTPGTRFAGSKILVKSDPLHSGEHIMCESVACCSSFLHYHYLDSTLAELMDTLRLPINDMLCLTISTQKRSRLLRHHWEIKRLEKMTGLLLDPVVLNKLSVETMQRYNFKYGGAGSP